MQTIKFIQLIRSLPDADKHIFECVDEHTGLPEFWVTNEWLVGSFAGAGFEGASIAEAANHMIDYLNAHIGTDTFLGYALRNAGWPDYRSVQEYCLNRIELQQ